MPSLIRHGKRRSASVIISLELAASSVPCQDVGLSPLHRHDRLSLRIALAAPEARFEVEDQRLGRQP